jgi:HSP20 family protein
MSTWTFARDPFRLTSPLFQSLWPNHDTQVVDSSPASVVSIRPNADVIVSDRAYRLRIELPGVRVEDVDVTVDQSTLSLSVERSSASLEDGERFIARGLQAVSFQRSWRLPEDVSDDIKATARDGVVEIVIERSAKPSAKRIAISPA